MSPILEQIPKDQFLLSPEPTAVYRLGLFQNATHDLVELFANVVYPPHYHLKAEGFLHFVVGTGVITIDGKEEFYAPGQSFFIAKGVKHGFQPTTQTLILSIQSPPVKNKDNEEDLYY